MMLKRRQSKQHQAKDGATQQQQEVKDNNNTGNNQQQIECIIPAVISAPTDAASQQEMLRRTHHTRSLSKGTRDSSTEGLSATQIAFLASDENGVVVTSNRYVKRLSSSSRKLPSVNPASYADTDDTSTLPTFVSVGDDIISWQQTNCLLSSSQGAAKTFLVSKDNDDTKKKEQQPPQLTLVSLEAQNSRHDREDALRKKLHYKTKLRSLTDQLTASSAVEQSRKMLSPDTSRRIDSGIVASPERSKQVKKGGTSKTTNDLNNDCCVGDSPLPKEASASDSKPHRILSGMYKALTACTTSLCLDDTVVNHEGTIIEYPTKKKKSLRSKVSQAQTTSSSCMCAGDILHSKERSQDSGSSDDITDISSLTGMTPYRYQKKHWMHHYDIHESEMTWV